MCSVQNQNSNSWEKIPKTKQTQLPGLNYWDRAWFQLKDLVEILQYLVPWGLMPFDITAVCHTLLQYFIEIPSKKSLFCRKYLKGKS